MSDRHTGSLEISHLLDREMRALQAARLVDESSLAELGHPVLGVLAGWVVWESAPHLLVVAWVTAIAAAAGVRTLLRLRARRMASAVEAVGPVRLAVAAVAVAWGLGALAVSPYAAIEEMTLLLVLFAGLVAAGTTSLQADPPSFYLFVAGLLAPMTIAVAQNGETRNHGLGVLFVGLYGVAMVAFYRRAHVGLTSHLRTAKRLELTERAAGRERALLDALIAGAPQAIAVVSRDGAITRANRSFEQMFGYSPGELIGHSINDLVVPEEFQAESDDFRERVWKGEVIVRDVTRRRKDGSQFDARVAASAVSVGGEQVAFVIYDDITERKRAESLIRATEQRYRQLVESASDLVWQLDAEGRFTFVNAAAAEILNLKPEEVVGRFLLDFSDPDYREGDRAMLAELARGEGVLDHETVLRDVHGSPTALSTSAHPIWDSSGKKVVGVQGIARDVGAQVVARQAMASAKRAAEETAAARSAFLANMSHEIRTPMNGILGMVELLLDTTLDAEQRRSIDLIKESGESLMTIINDILDFSKIEAGQLALEETEFDLPGLVEAAVRLLTPRAFDRGIELVCDVHVDVPHVVRGDPGRLRQVLNNLIGNALKFTHKGEVVVSAAASAAASGKSAIRIGVRDTGIGIQQDKLETIFEAFKQADVSTTRRYGGTGLGLSISRRLVEMMGGILEVTSTVGKGSEFFFSVSLPVAKRESAGLRLGPTLAGKRVLVIDDHALNRKVTREMLLVTGCVVIEAEDGDRGLAALREARARKEPVDLVLSDVHMPARDGFEFATLVRADPDLSGTRIMLLTSAGRRGDGQRCRDLGISAYLLKPVSRVELLEAAATALAERPARPSSVQLVTRHSIQESRRGRKVLVAEDNPVNQEVAAAMLRKRGHDVTIVENGRLAVEAVRKDAFDVVLMDLQMPELDGLRATKEIRDFLDGRPLPIVAVTANALSGERERCLAGGMDGYLAKPFKPHELFAVVEGWSDGSRVERPSQGGVTMAAVAAVDVDGFRAEMREAGIEETVGEVMGLFLRDAPQRLAALEEAVKGGDTLKIERAAHAFKSASVAIRAKRLGELLKEVEQAGRDGDATKASGFLSNIKVAAAEATTYLLSRDFSPGKA